MPSGRCRHLAFGMYRDLWTKTDACARPRGAKWPATGTTIAPLQRNAARMAEVSGTAQFGRFNYRDGSSVGASARRLAISSRASVAIRPSVSLSLSAEDWR